MIIIDNVGNEFANFNSFWRRIIFSVMFFTFSLLKFPATHFYFVVNILKTTQNRIMLMFIVNNRLKIDASVILIDTAEFPSLRTFTADIIFDCG